MKKDCSACDFGEINYWGYIECFKFITNIDTETTFFTAAREKDAKRLNSDGRCSWYRRIPWYVKLWRKMIGYKIVRGITVKKFYWIPIVLNCISEKDPKNYIWRIGYWNICRCRI